jgi:parvulin-like peptidyl-prolyl isomerase
LAKKKDVKKPPREMTRRQLSRHKKQQRRQRIIFISGISIIVVVILILLVGWFNGEYRPMHRTVIRVGDVKFDTRYYIDSLKGYGAGQSAEQFRSITSSVTSNIVRNEIMRQAAEKLGIVVSDEDVMKALGNPDKSIPDAYLDAVRAQLVQERVKDEYISTLVPVSDNQVNIMAMLVESDTVARELRDRLVTGDNFTALAAEFAQNYTSKQNNGEYGWHPRAILDLQLGSNIPIDFAFSAAPGTLSQPLHDADSYKQLGYWLIRVQEITEDGEATVQALFLSSRAEAQDIRARLVAGDNLTALADEYSQYSPSQEGHGELGQIAQPDDPEKMAITEVFDGYVFAPDVKMGEWSEPLSDNGTLWTKGGAWLVELIDRENDRELSDEDRDTLIENVFEDWQTVILQEVGADVDSSGLTQEVDEWAIERALAELQQEQGQVK